MFHLAVVRACRSYAGSCCHLRQRETAGDCRRRRLLLAGRVSEAKGLGRHQDRLRRRGLRRVHGPGSACPKPAPSAIGRSFRAFGRVHQLDGTHVVTIEGLTPRGELSPIQQAMVEHHGSQCGFCTPGFVDGAHGALRARGSRGRRRAARRTRRQPVPVHRLCADPRRGPVGRRRERCGRCRVSIRRERWSTSLPHAARMPACRDRGRARGFSFARSGSKRRSPFAHGTPGRSSSPAAPSSGVERQQAGPRAGGRLEPRGHR